MEVTSRDPQLQCLQKRENMDRDSRKMWVYRTTELDDNKYVMAIYDIIKLVLSDF